MNFTMNFHLISPQNFNNHMVGTPTRALNSSFPHRFEQELRERAGEALRAAAARAKRSAEAGGMR